MAVLPLDLQYDWYLETLHTARKRADLARRRGYTFQRFERADHGDDVNAVNQSKGMRQGRPMSETYLNDQEFSPIGEQPCGRHRVNQYGVFYDDVVVAYAIIVRSGELALVSQILGHGQWERDGIMQLLGVEVYRSEQPTGGQLVYNRWDSGTDGLRQAKRWLGYKPTRIKWAP